MAQPNLPELKRLNMWVQEQNRLEPGARIWNQDDWVNSREESPMCQTAYCVAGMAIVRAGHRFTREHGSEYFAHLGWISTDQMHLDGVNVKTRDVRDYAAEILGIDYETAEDLFDGSNEANYIDRAIRDIFLKAEVDYDAVEPAPPLEIEIKAAEAVRPQLLPSLINK